MVSKILFFSKEQDVYLSNRRSWSKKMILATYLVIVWSLLATFMISLSACGTKASVAPLGALAPSPPATTPDPAPQPQPNPGPQCSGTHVGIWNGVAQKDRIQLKETCDFLYSGVDGCTSHGTFSQPQAINGTLHVTIQEASVGNCMGVGSYSCQYQLAEGELQFDCGVGVASYTR